MPSIRTSAQYEVRVEAGEQAERFLRAARDGHFIAMPHKERAQYEAQTLLVVHHQHPSHDPPLWPPPPMGWKACMRLYREA